MTGAASPLVELISALDAAVSAELAAESAAGLPAINSYLVSDPWAEQLIRADVCGWLAEPGWPGGIASGSSPAALLAALAGLAQGGAIQVAGEGSAELVRAASRLGVPVHGATPTGPITLIHLRRPWSAVRLAEVADLARQAEPVPVLVDETDLELAPAAESAAALTGTLDNLLVVRGLPRLGRFADLVPGLCLSSAALTGRLQAIVPPLFAAPLALRIARVVLGLIGTGELAEQARQHRRQANLALADRLTAAGAGVVELAVDAPALRTDRAGADLAAGWGWPSEPDVSYRAATGRLVRRRRLPVAAG